MQLMLTPLLASKTAMSLLFWASLGLLLASATGGIAFVVVKTLELFRTMRASGRVISAGAQRILDAAAAMEQRASRIGPDPRLARRASELEGSIADLRVLLGELGRVRARVGAVRAVVPPK
jgi:hypothetical protein